MFEREKLSGTNFNDWFRQLKLVLRVEKKVYVIKQPIPPAHAANFEAQVLADWNAVYDAHNEVACLMLESMTPKLHRKFESYSPYEMLQELMSMFEKQARVGRFDLIQTFHSCKQNEGKSVSLYVLKMKGYMEQLERLGYVLSQDLSVGLIMNSLTSDFVRFVRNYNMHNMRKTIGELHDMFIEYEKGLPKKAATPQVMTIQGGRIQKANKKSQNAKGKGKDKLVYIPKPKNPKPSSKEHPAKDDTCHHCKELELPVLQGLREVRKLKQGALYLYMGNGIRAQVEAIGSFDLVLPNGLVIYLDDCHYAPTITRGVVPVSHLVNNGFIQRFMDYGISVSKNDVLYFNAIPRDGIYEIDMLNLVPNVNSIYNDSYFITFTDDYSCFGVCYNMVPPKKVDKTLYELWYGKVPNLSYLKVWGCEALVKRDTLDKLQQRSVKCIFIGYPKETMGYYFYFPLENKIVVASKIHVEVEGFEPPQEEVIRVRMSVRAHRAPERLCLNVELNAMNAEMQSMKDNQVWRLVDLPPNGETVRSKWLFKKKTDMDGVVHTYKAHLVAKGFTQTFGVDYEETFSPIVDIRAIRILIAIAAFYDYKVWQMDVQTAFLNGYLDEDIYMVQPEGFVDPKHPRKVCKLHRSIYGLKQASRSWNKIFDEEIKKFSFAQNLDELYCYCDAGFETNRDDTKSQSGYVEYIAASEAAMKAVWIRKFISGLGIVPTINEPIKMFCDNSAALIIANKPGVQKDAIHYQRRYHYVCECIELSEINLLKVHTDNNLADPFMKALSKGKLTQHARSMGLLFYYLTAPSMMILKMTLVRDVVDFPIESSYRDKRSHKDDVSQVVQSAEGVHSSPQPSSHHNLWDVIVNGDQKKSSAPTIEKHLPFLAPKTGKHCTNKVITASGDFGVSIAGGINQVPSTPCIGAQDGSREAMTGAHDFDVELVNYALDGTSPFSSLSSSHSEKVVKERNELKDKIAKWEESSKNLDEILNSQISARDKTGLGYSTQLNELSSNHEMISENSFSVFDGRSSDEESTLANDRSSKSSIGPVSTARPSISTARPSISTASTARPVCTARPSISTARTSINTASTARPSISTARPVCTARPSISTARPVYASRPCLR
ncbi:retrotransposon protein, putative, ty1-copia subclass [Tanacetum coccineum]